MARSAKIYDFSIPANGSFQLLVEGSFYRIQQSTGALEVRRDGGSGVGPIYAGQGERDEEFKYLTLIDKTGAINNGFIVVSDGTFVDDRTTGEVSIVDGEAAKTRSNIAFMAFGSLSGVAAQCSAVEIWNPAGSGKRLIVSDLIASSASQSAAAINKITATMGAAGVPQSKLINATGSTAVAKVGASNVAAVPGVTIENQFIQAYQPFARAYKQPIVIEPGFGIVVWNTLVNSSLVASVQFTEEVIL
jgi:hypothetical protein